jgi:hypothetical protein
MTQVSTKQSWWVCQDSCLPPYYWVDVQIKSANCLEQVLQWSVGLSSHPCVCHKDGTCDPFWSYEITSTSPESYGLRGKVDSPQPEVLQEVK